VSTKNSVRRVAAFLFSVGSGPLWEGSPGATCISQARKNRNLDTQGCKTAGLKTYLSPGSAFYFQMRRAMRREIPGLPVRRTQTGLQKDTYYLLTFVRNMGASAFAKASARQAWRRATPGRQRHCPFFPLWTGKGLWIPPRYRSFSPGKKR